MKRISISAKIAPENGAFLGISLGLEQKKVYKVLEKSKNSENHIPRDTKKKFRSMDKEEIITNLPEYPIQTKPSQLIRSDEILPITAFFSFLLISIPSILQIIIGELNSKYIIPALFLFALGAIGLYYIKSIFINRYINMKIYYSKYPQAEQYKILVWFGKVSIGTVEDTRLYGDRKLIRYHFSYQDKVVYGTYVTNKDVQYDFNDIIFVLHYKDICSIPLVID